MVDILLMHALLKAVPNQSAMLIVGDVDQLPSVRAGQVLADVIGAGAIPVVRLIEVFRQAAKSRIIVNAHRVNLRIPTIVTRARCRNSTSPSRIATSISSPRKTR